MTTEFQIVQERYKLTNADAAFIINKSMRTVTRYRNGKVQAPDLIIKALESEGKKTSETA